MNNPFEEINEKLSNIESLLLDLKRADKPSEDLNHPLTINQASEFIKLSVPTIYGLVGKNEIPFSKKGKRLYFCKKELVDWINEGRKKTRTELSEAINDFMRKKKR